MNKILVLGDIHFPYQHTKAVREALYAVKHEKPTHIVQIGDLYDQYSFSRFTRKNITSPEEEVKKGRESALTMWSTVNRFSPGSKKYQILGNHDIRLIKRVQERLPEAQDIIKRSVMELYNFKGVTTIEDDRSVLKIGNVAFHHGYLSQLGAHRDYFMSSTVVGHSHTGGVSYRQIHRETLWELNVGYLADQTSEPLRYNPTKVSKWTLGFGLIDRQGPRFIPL